MYPLIEMDSFVKCLLVGVDWILLYSLYSLLWYKKVLRVMVCIILVTFPIVISIQGVFSGLVIDFLNMFALNPDPEIVLKVMIAVILVIVVFGAMDDEEGNLFKKH